MGTFRVTYLPEILESNSTYVVENTGDIEIVQTDSSGQIIPPGSSGGSTIVGFSTESKQDTIINSLIAIKEELQMTFKLIWILLVCTEWIFGIIYQELQQ